MSRQGYALGVVTLAAAVVLAGCVSEVGGSPALPSADQRAAGATEAPAATGTTTAPSTDRSVPGTEPGGTPPGLAGTGDCVSTDATTVVDCAGDHTVEIVDTGTLDDADGATPPPEQAVYEAVLPDCRTAVADFLGSADYDVTTLGAWLFWADEDRWDEGQRWYRCGVAQVNADGEPRTRQGSLHDALAGDDGLDGFRLCSRERPADERPRAAPCDGPHRSEAVAAIPLGTPDGALPDVEKINALGRQECGQAVRGYLGADRDDIGAAWRWPREASWRQGFTNLLCFAETEQPVDTLLRDIGTEPLPTA
ncbi:septum formation family protein [Saccharomonospora iraqiensis]|uniref:septum formation family protein n=1 Tax=Saccharomonospora iraqiensis TaxID=52698 RepID=UPI000478CEBC|nr:septum formation family protein [Saccharomonospora iraqiensis]